MISFEQFNLKVRLLKMVGNYRQRAHANYLAGGRPYYLPCEKQIGGHCAALFERDLKSNSIFVTIKRFLYRCPKGKMGAIAGLLGGLIMILPLSSFSNGCLSCDTNQSNEKGCFQETIQLIFEWLFIYPIYALIAPIIATIGAFIYAVIAPIYYCITCPSDPSKMCD